jgi:branched-chain amino acid transport system permease protein
MVHLFSFATYLLAATCISCLLTFSLDLQLGYCGLVNFGQAGFLLAGGYATAILIGLGVPVFPSILAAILAGGLLGILLAFTVRNMSGTYWGILSLALAELLRLVVLNEQWIAGGANGQAVLIPVPDFTLIVVVTTIGVYLLMRAIGNSPFGRVLRLIREGDRLPLALGKHVLLFKIETMFIGGAIGGLAGAFYALLNKYISPYDSLPIETFLLWAMVIIGGRGNPTGIVLGTVLVQTLYMGTRFLTGVLPISPDTASALRLVVIGTLVTLTMMFRPQGLLPERRRILQ